MKKIILLIAVSFFGLQATENLDSVFGKIPMLPKEDLTKINDWLLKERDLIGSLVIQDGSLADYSVIHKNNNELMQTKGIVNYSRSNYVFVCPAAPQYMIKISGPVNRLVNMIVADNKRPTTIEDDEIKALKRVTTYQTISSLPTYYFYLRFRSTMPSKYVYIPQTYLLKLPGASDIIADVNYIIVQERVALIEKPEAEKRITQLNDEQMKELIAVIASCGLWDIKNKIHIAQDGRLVIVDLEQPNISNPIKGLNIQDTNRFYHNVFCGLDSLKELFNDKDELIDDYAQNFIE